MSVTYVFRDHFHLSQKVKDINFIKTATKIITGSDYKIDYKPEKYTGVKVPQFSFNRLANADNRLGVEMLSTGEVACFGENWEAYLKALVATGFKVHNKCNVLVSIGLDIDRLELLRCIKLLSMNGFTLYGTPGTAEYYKNQGVKIAILKQLKYVIKLSLDFWIGYKHFSWR